MEGRALLLYHFTTRALLPAIRQGGLSRGTIHVSATERRNGVWLTTDPGSGGHGLETGGAFMSDDQRREAQEWSGTLPLPGARFPKNAEVRIAVDLASGDPQLHEWLPWARRHLDAEWMAHLHPITGGTLKKAKTWRIYLGVIPPEAFAAVEELAAPSAVVPLRPGRPSAVGTTRPIAL